MQKYLPLFLLCLIMMSCSNNFEKISKDPTQLSALKKSVEQADIIGAWNATKIVVPTLDKSFFDDESDYKRYVRNKNRIEGTDFEKNPLTLRFNADGTMGSVTPDGDTHSGTYTLANNILSTIERNQEQDMEVRYLKKNDAVFLLAFPNPSNPGQEIKLYMVMKREG